MPTYNRHKIINSEVSRQIDNAVARLGKTPDYLELEIIVLLAQDGRALTANNISEVVQFSKGSVRRRLGILLKKRVVYKKMDKTEIPVVDRWGLRRRLTGDIS